MKKILVLVCSFGLLSSYSPVYGVEMVNDVPLCLVISHVGALVANSAIDNPIIANVVGISFVAATYAIDYFRRTREEQQRVATQQIVRRRTVDGEQIDTVQHVKPEMNYTLNCLASVVGYIDGALLGYSLRAATKRLMSSPQPKQVLGIVK